jgi:predicted membrane channel-forming protein YqfA (hemolysin III family)
MSIPGTIAVLIAALVVKSLPLDVLRWLVIGIVLYTSGTMFRAALQRTN